MLLFYFRRLRKFDSSFEIYLPKNSKKDLYKWYLKVCKPLLNLNKQTSDLTSKLVAIDIVIPTTNKDFSQLEKVILGARQFISHEIKNIFIVAPFSSEILKISEKLGCIYINENTLTDIKKIDITYKVNGIDRSGWLYQQILKLSSDKISTQEHFLILDSDTILTKKHNFIYKNKIIFNHSDEYHLPYYAAFRKIFGYDKVSSLSFVCHYMLFTKKYLKEMKREMASQNNSTWEKAIISNVLYNESSGFSEYETYGNFMLKNHKNRVIREYWFNISVSSIPKCVPNYIKSVSLHSYNRTINDSN